MPHSNLTYRCYILPVIAAILYYILSLPLIVEIFNDWIPDYYYATLVKALIILIVLFLVCRLLDFIWTDTCHDNLCMQNTICLNNNAACLASIQTLTQTVIQELPPAPWHYPTTHTSIQNVHDRYINPIASSIHNDAIPALHSNSVPPPVEVHAPSTQSLDSPISIQKSSDESSNDSANSRESSNDSALGSSESPDKSDSESPGDSVSESSDDSRESLDQSFYIVDTDADNPNTDHNCFGFITPRY